MTDLKITAARAAEIQARLDKYGSRGLLWQAFHSDSGSGVFIDEDGDAPTIVATTSRLNGADADLIAPAPADLADLLSDRATMAAEIERLTRRLQAAEKVVDAVQVWAFCSSNDENQQLLDALTTYRIAMPRQAPETAPGSDQEPTP